LLHELRILLNKSHLSLLCAKLSLFELSWHNNSSLRNNLEHLCFTW